MKKLLLFALPLLVLLAVLFVLFRSDDERPSYQSVAVARGSVVREALAAGRIEPRFEVPVKSRIGGVVTAKFVQLGQRVSKDQPLVEVRPVLTDLDLLQAERALQSALEARDNASEIRAGENLMGRTMLWFQGRDNVERMERGVERAVADAEEWLELLRQGTVEIEGKRIDYVVRAPIDGQVIDLDLELGEPVVPASSYGSGTELLILADMDQPVFRGTVGEIDVGRLRAGMRAELDIGALPAVVVAGELIEVSLRSRSVNNATVFDVKLSVTPPEGLVLRSGYSAVARIELARVEQVPVLPERLVEYRGEQAFVLVADEEGGATEREIVAGLSDGLTVEIVEGLGEGDAALERVW